MLRRAHHWTENPCGQLKLGLDVVWLLQSNKLLFYCLLMVPMGAPLRALFTIGGYSSKWAGAASESSGGQGQKGLACGLAVETGQQFV